MITKLFYLLKSNAEPFRIVRTSIAHLLFHSDESLLIFSQFVKNVLDKNSGHTHSAKIFQWLHSGTLLEETSRLLIDIFSFHNFILKSHVFLHCWNILLVCSYNVESVGLVSYQGLMYYYWIKRNQLRQVYKGILLYKPRKGRTADTKFFYQKQLQCVFILISCRIYEYMKVRPSNHVSHRF